MGWYGSSSCSTSIPSLEPKLFAELLTKWLQSNTGRVLDGMLALAASEVADTKANRVAELKAEIAKIEAVGAEKKEG